ncbi:MAG: GTPase [Nitrospirae bacterium]|nr:GTPase [Nitrospirota bacterium]
MNRRRIIIMGAGGRDFHNFNVRFRGDRSFEVVAFTSAQIPYFASRLYPPSLSGKLYSQGIPIHPEEGLARLIDTLAVDEVVFAYSDVSHEYVMHKASEVLAAGADFSLLGPDSTMLRSTLPVISVCAVRTGCGKSPVTRMILDTLKGLGRRPVAIRHPMAYCDLEKQRAQRFAVISDLDSELCTVEEREEYEPLVEKGFTVFAGVDYADVLDMAEAEGDVIVWDGGNNDFPFIRPDLEIVVADALRPGQCDTHHPGETNFRRAEVIIVNKAGEDSMDAVEAISETLAGLNPNAHLIPVKSHVEMYPATGSPLTSLIGRKVLVVEDGPTITHGGMPYGAGLVAAQEHGCTVVSPWPHARGSLKALRTKYPHIGDVLPAVGYGPEQLRDLEATIGATPCDAVVFATPVDLVKLIKIKKPAYRVRYEIRELHGDALASLVTGFVKDI